jgi:Gas vesicle synthesis protein GvpL/GvpF
MTNEGVGDWVYAIFRADHSGDRTVGLRGVAGEPIRTVLGRDLAAAVGTVSLEDRDWSAAKARAHNDVVSAIGRSGSVIPVRMATIYRDDLRVCQLLLKEQEDIELALRRMSGREEIGVKAYSDPKSVAIQGDSIQLRSAESRSRTANLLRRRRLLASHAEAYRLATEEADRVHAVLLRCSVDGKLKPPPNNRSTGEQLTVLSGAYLVDGGMVNLFKETVSDLEQSTARIRLEVTGPWPPYSFAEDLVAI